MGYVARSAFKLLEIQTRFCVLPKRPCDVLDLGSAPGAWLQVASQHLAANQGGSLHGVDLQAVDLSALRHVDASRTRVLRGDALALPRDTFLPLGYHAVLSDMCPHTTGSASLDACRSGELALSAARLALGDVCVAPLLRLGGSLVVKLLEGAGGGRKDLDSLCRPSFERTAWFRPRATRSESREVFLVCLSKKSGLPRGV